MSDFVLREPCFSVTAEWEEMETQLGLFAALLEEFPTIPFKGWCCGIVERDVSLMPSTF